MKKKYIIHIFSVLLIFSACKKEELPVYDSPQFIEFAGNTVDTVILSFFFYPNQNQVKIPLPVKLTGFMPKEDLSYKIAVDKTVSTALPANYELPAEYFYRKGKVTDSAYVIVKKSAELATKSLLLVLEMTGGANVYPGQTSQLRRAFKINDMVSQPGWWNADMVRFYLGVYTETKYRKFMEVVGVGDLSLYSTSQQRAYMLEFKYYLIKMKDAGTPVLENDGKDMLSTIPLIG